MRGSCDVMRIKHGSTVSSFGAALAELLVGTGGTGVIFGAGWAKRLEIAPIVPMVTDCIRCRANPKSGASAVPPLSRAR
jgi:hypothetical protein